MARPGCSGARLTQRRRLRRRQSQSAGGAAFAGRGGNRLGWEDLRGRGEGERTAERASTHFRRDRDHTLTRTECVRDTRRAGALSSGWPPFYRPPSPNTHPEVLLPLVLPRTPIPPRPLPPSPPNTLQVGPPRREGGSTGNEKRGGGREMATWGGAIGMGGQCKGRVTSGSGRAYPAPLAPGILKPQVTPRRGGSGFCPGTR